MNIMRTENGVRFNTESGHWLSLSCTDFYAEYAIMSPNDTFLIVEQGSPENVGLWIELLKAYDSGCREDRDRITDAIAEAEYENEIKYEIL